MFFFAGTGKRALLRCLHGLIIGALILHAAGVVESQDVADRSLANAIEAQIDVITQPGAAQIRGLSIAWPQLIHQFYAQRDFRPAWDRPGVVNDLHRALRDSRDDGLDPKDYYSNALATIATEVRTGKADTELRAQFDVLNTEALLRLGYHLSFGKVDPQSFDSQWNYGRTLEKLNVAQEIERALDADDVYNRIESLKPTHSLYINLKRELARYRAIAAAGGWKPIPEGPALKPGAIHARVAALRARLQSTGDIVPAAGDPQAYDSGLESAVRSYQERLGLEADGVAGARTIAELNVLVSARNDQIRINLDRGRVLLQDLPDEFVVVNVAGYQVYLVRGGEVVWWARAQVGKPYRRTPIFRSQITYLVWNPTWTVPPGIIANDILPDARRDPASISKRGLRVLDRAGRDVDPATIDWNMFRSGNIPYTLRQDPGPKNALGRVKFMFPNDYAVYLHDTPSTSLFDATDRSFSSGCVRVENPLEFARLLLDDPAAWNDAAIAQALESGRTQNVTLKRKIPVLLTYWTAWVDPQGRVNFRRDIYGQDDAWAKGLAGEFVIRKQQLTRGSR
jgi:murein L,D-transpeptidase YcbB/YkuD